LFKFQLHPTSALALPEKPTKQIMYEIMNEKNFNKFYQSRYLAPNSQLITRFDCHKAMRLPDDVQKCL